MDILTARYKGVKVEVHDSYRSGGILYVAIKACEGKPFIGGSKWPVWTDWTTARYDELVIGMEPLPPESKVNLLTLALAQARKQWASGQSIWLWQGRENGRKHGAFLKNHDGRVALCITGYRESLEIWWLDLRTGEWKQTPNLEKRYRTWARSAQKVTSK